MTTYLRFVVHEVDGDSGKRQGLFQAAAALDHAGLLVAHEREDYDRLRRWFADNLDAPTRLAVTRRPHAKAQALSWFKSTASEHLRHMRLLRNLLDRHGVVVEVVRTERPGYIVYEDEVQVAAHPFADTPT